jgi:hypothetical protein
VYRWHWRRLNPVQDIKQASGNADAEPVQDVKQEGESQLDGNRTDNPVYDVKQTESNQAIADCADDVVQNVKQHGEPVADDGGGNLGDFDQIHFAVQIPAHYGSGSTRRTTVMLERYLVGALGRRHGLSGNAAIRAWIEQAIKNDGVRFDSHAPLTRQVKRLIVESLI